MSFHFIQYLTFTAFCAAINLMSSTPVKYSIMHHMHVVFVLWRNGK